MQLTTPHSRGNHLVLNNLHPEGKEGQGQGDSRMTAGLGLPMDSRSRRAMTLRGAPPQNQKVETTCVIPFRSDISGDEVRSEQTLRTIESEFVSKYLEKIGVTPTKATADLMRRLTPINLSTLENQLKPGKGSETEVCITLKPPERSGGGGGSVQNTAKGHLSGSPMSEGPTSENLISLGVLAQLPKEFREELEWRRLAKEKADVSSFEDPASSDGNDSGRGANVFTQASSQHLFPYNLKNKKKGTGRRSNKFQDGIFHHNTTHAHQKRSGQQGQDPNAPGLQDEVTEHLVEEFQADFLQGLEDWKQENGVSLKGSIYLRDRAFQSVQDTLLSRPVLKLFKTAGVYLIEKFVGRRAGTGRGGAPESVDLAEPRKAKEQAERLFLILNEFSRLCKANRKEKVGLCFVLPIVLLSLRAFVEHVTRLLYPTLMSSPEGKEVASRMDSTITTLLDPHSWYSRVSVFQSTRTAMQIMTAYRQSAHQPIRYNFHHTSPLVRAALGNPLSSQYRSFIHNSEKHAIKEKRQLAEIAKLGVGHRERLLGKSLES